MTASELRVLLHRHHLPKRKGTQKWILLEEVRRGVGYAPTRTLDAMAICCYGSSLHRIVGYEIKVTRKDFFREMADPEKHQVFYDWVDRFVLVTPHKLVQPSEIPACWGLLEVAESGRWLNMVKQPRKLGVESVISVQERARLVCMLKGRRSCG